VVDPDERRSTWLADLLSLRGHKPVRVASGEKAIDLFIQEPADALMVQFALPGRDGVATVEAIRWAPKGRDVRVVLLAHEEPVSAPLQMLALKVDAVSAFVGELSLSQVRRAVDDIENRSGHTDSTMALEDERAQDLVQRARRGAPIDTVDGHHNAWLEVTTMVAGHAPHLPVTEMNLAQQAAEAVAAMQAEEPAEASEVDDGTAHMGNETPTAPPPAEHTAPTTPPPALAAVSDEETVASVALSPPSRPRFGDAEEDATTFDPVRPDKPAPRPLRASAARFAPVRSTFRAPTRTSSSSGAIPASPTPSGLEQSAPVALPSVAPETFADSAESRVAIEDAVRASFPPPPMDEPVAEEPVADVEEPAPVDLEEASPFNSDADEAGFVQTDAYPADDDDAFPGEEHTQAMQFVLPRPLDLVDPLGKTQFAKAPPTNEHLRDPETMSEGRLVREAAQAPQAADWSGSYVDTTFPAVLRRIADNRASGALVSTLPVKNPDGSISRRTLDNGAPSKVVYFRAGVPVEVRSNLRDECLGQLLLRKKRITIATLEESIRRQQREGGFQGEILIAMGALTAIELGETLSEQVRQKLFELFGWRTGSFRFTANVEPPRGGVAIEMALPEMVYEGVCAAMPATTLRDIMTPRLEYFVVPDAMRLSRFARVNLAKDLRVVLERLDGTLQLREVLSLGQRPGAIAQLVFALESLGGVTYEPALLLRRVELPPRSEEMTSALVSELVVTPPPPEEDDAWDDSTVLRTPREAKMGALPRSQRETVAQRRPESTPSEPIQQVLQSFAQPLPEPPPEPFVEPFVEALPEPAQPVYAVTSPPAILAQPAVAAPLEKDPALDEHVDRMFDAERLFRKGNRALERGDSVGAIASFERASQLCPEEGEFLAYLGWARHCAAPQDGEAAFTALHELSRSVSLAPDLHVAHLLYARVLEHVKRYDEARQGFQQVLMLEPSNAEAAEALRRLYPG
jgi:hypothetical protein